MDIRIERYQSNLMTDWDNFVKSAKNGLFLFERNYMDYHASRFTDHSLLFYCGNMLLAVLPGTESDKMYISHEGLTYGGLILPEKIFISQVAVIFDSLLAYLTLKGFQTFVYKAIPAIFHSLPAQEDLYFLFKNNATLFKRDVNSVIDFSHQIRYTKGVKHNLAKAKKASLIIKKSIDFDAFMSIESNLLKEKYKTKPTHSAAEIKLLAKRFPNNIRLYLVFQQNTCLGGIIIYSFKGVDHMQYSGFTDCGKKAGAFAFLTEYLIKKASAQKYFSFGISTTHSDNYLNEGLAFSKESFMARTLVNDTYMINLTN